MPNVSQTVVAVSTTLGSDTQFDSILLVSHPNEKREFAHDWSEAVKEVGANEEEYVLIEIVRVLEENGWQIEMPIFVNVNF